MRAPDAGPFLGELTESVALQFLAAAPFSLVLTDPRQPDNPIVYANQAFCDISGYPKSEIIGRNCRFLQGPATDPHTVERIQKALRDNDEVMVDILNYHKNGTPLWNRLLISPLRAPDGTVLFFSGVQLLFIGVIGEYLGRMFEETKQRPLYLVQSLRRPRAQAADQPADQASNTAATSPGRRAP